MKDFEGKKLHLWLANVIINPLYLFEESVFLCTQSRAMVPKVVQSSQALAAKILLANNLHLIKKGAFQKSANFSRPTNHAQVIEPIGSLCMICGSGTEGKC